MAKFIGRLVQLGLAKESVRGAGASPDIWLPYSSCSVAVRVDEARIGGALGSLADSEEKLVVEKYAEGEVSGEVRSQSIGYLLYALLGSVSTSGSGPYTHSFSLDESNQHQSLALTIKEGDLVTEMYKLAVLNSLGISVELGGLVNFTAGFIAKAPVTTSQTPSYTTEYKFSKKHVKIRVASDLSGLDSASDLDIKSLNINFAKNAERDSALGTVQPVDILNKTFSVEGTVNLNYEDNTWRDYMTDGSVKALRITIENTDVDLGGGVYPRLKFEFPKVDFSGWEIDRSLEEIVKQTINFKANYDSSNGIVSTCELINNKASY